MPTTAWVSYSVILASLKARPIWSAVSAIAAAELRAERELGLAAPPLAIDGEARAVGPAVGQRGEHGLGQAAELGLKRWVFEEEADNAAHAWKAPGQPGLHHATAARPLVNPHEIKFPGGKAPDAV